LDDDCMKIFLSWSGDLSRSVAELLASWIPDVLQGTLPWISNKDIDKGAIWFDEITSTLADVKAGILFVSRQNQTAPWLLFEAGALSKGLSKNRVIPLLIDLTASDVRPPLSQFNCSGVTKDEMLRLVLTLNKQRTEPLTEDQAKKAVNRCWSEFDDPFRKLVAAKTNDSKQEKRPAEDMILEILALSRSIHRHVEVTKDKSEKPSSPLDVMADLADYLHRNREEQTKLLQSAVLTPAGKLKASKAASSSSASTSD
jgi:hypothetical protein